MRHTKERDAEKAAIIAKTARITGLSKRYVQLVINGERNSELVMDTYMLFQEGNEDLMRKAQEMNRQVRKHTAAA